MITNKENIVFLGSLDEKWKSRIREWRNCESVWKWCRQNDLITESDHNAWWEWQAKDKNTKMYLVFSILTQKPVGVCGLTSIDYFNRRAEFSLYIEPLSQGNGFGKSALKLLLEHAFNNLGLNCIWGESFEGNPAIKIFESIGFKKEGIRREFYFRNGRFINCNLFSITSNEYFNGIPIKKEVSRVDD